MDGNGQSANGLTESDPGARTDLAIWFFFQIAAGHVGLPILVATFLFAKSVRRDPTLINMCITWIIADVSSCLLLYAGEQTGPEPGHAFCLLQASLLYGTPAMTAVSALALVLTVWTSMSRPNNSHQSGAWFFCKLIAPYVALLTFAVATAIVGANDIKKVNRNRRFFYCSVDDNPLTDTMAMFTAIVCLICLIFEVFAAVHIYRSWRAFRALRKSGMLQQSGYETARRGFDKQLVIRLFLFSGYIGIAMIFSLISLESPKTVVPDIFASSIGMAVFLIFGTQMDIFRAWAFWLPSRGLPQPSTRSSTFKDANWLISRRSSTLTMPEELSQPPIPPPKDKTILVITGPATPVTRNDLDVECPIPHQPAAEASTRRNSIDAVLSLRSSLNSRKGDSVIIIQKPEDAFEKLGEANHAV